MDPGGPGTRAWPRPPSPASTSSARPCNPPVTPRTTGSFHAPPASTVYATAPRTTNAAASPPADGPNTQLLPSIVDAAATSTVGAAAAPANVGPTWRPGPCLHPKRKPAPLPPSSPCLSLVGNPARSDNGRDRPLATATSPPPFSLQVGGDGDLILF